MLRPTAGLLAAVIALSASDTGHAEATADRYTGPIIDSHAHIRLPGQPAIGDQPEGTAPIRSVDVAAGVSRSALIVIARAGDPSATKAQNDAVLAAAAADPAHFYPIPSVHPADGDAAIAELVRLKGLGVREIKLHPNTQNFDVADPDVARVTQKCGELGMVVLFDSYKARLLIDRPTCRRCQDVD